jgi:phenylpyruvate tautomerase PptA (4-oxalocrotonate tautomerase family)
LLKIYEVKVPIVDISINYAISKDSKHVLQDKICTLISDVLNKKKTDIMVVLRQSEIFMNNSNAPAAFVQVLCLSGLNLENNEKVCNQIYSVLNSINKIESERIYINFKDINAEDGWKFVNNKALCPASKMSTPV